MSKQERVIPAASRGAGYTAGPFTLRGPAPKRLPMSDGGDYAIVDEHNHIIGEAIRLVAIGVEHDAHANAKLWASAPALVEALRALVEAHDADTTNYDAIDKARSALRSAGAAGEGA